MLDVVSLPPSSDATLKFLPRPKHCVSHSPGYSRTSSLVPTLFWNCFTVCNHFHRPVEMLHSMHVAFAGA